MSYSMDMLFQNKALFSPFIYIWSVLLLPPLFCRKWLYNWIQITNCLTVLSIHFQYFRLSWDVCMLYFIILSNLQLFYIYISQITSVGHFQSINKFVVCCFQNFFSSAELLFDKLCFNLFSDYLNDNSMGEIQHKRPHCS